LDIGQLGGMHPEQYLDCVGDRSVTLSGYIESADLPAQATGQPLWLVDSPQFTLTGAVGSAADGPLVWVHADPAASQIVVDEWVSVTGTFDHVAAQECERTVVGGLSPETADETHRWCRQQFVISEVRSIPPP
jgi:hypothetical protein